jgi:N-acetylneuraminate synthase/N,N'-diacetyllegionaminate synthase
VIAEIGINHDGNLDRAMQLIESAFRCGADAVKFQTFRADRLMIRGSQMPAHLPSESAFEMFRRLELSWEDHVKLKARSDDLGIVFLSTPFDEEGADFLDSLGVPAFKVASADITHLHLLRHLARKGKPILLSTGMSFLDEVARALAAITSQGLNDVALLHCVSNYPAPPESLNLRVLKTLCDYFDLPVGYSDHSEGIVYPLIAAVLGARILEKHFTLDKTAPGPDHRVSADPGELRDLVEHLADMEAALGDGRKRPADEEADNRAVSRRSIVAAVGIAPGQRIHSWMLDYKRPGTGLDPSQAERIVGRRARNAISKNKIIELVDLEIPDRSGVTVEVPELIGRPT